MPFEISWIAFLGYFAALAITLVMFLSPIILCAIRERSRSMLIVGFIVGLAIMAITVIAALSDPDGTLDSLALQTNRITSIAVSSSNGEIESSLVCGEDGVQSIKVLEDLRAETIECSYNKDGVRQILDLALTPNHPVTIVEERWGHKNRVWGLRVETDTFVSFVRDEGTTPHFDVWSIEKNLDEPGLSKSTNYTFTLESGYTVNWDDPEAPVSLK